MDVSEEVSLASTISVFPFSTSPQICRPRERQKLRKLLAFERSNMIFNEKLQSMYGISLRTSSKHRQRGGRGTADRRGNTSQKQRS